MTNNTETAFITEPENGRQTLVAVGRFAVSWDMAVVRALPRDLRRGFHGDTLELMYRMRSELLDPPMARCEIVSNRDLACTAFVGICAVDGTSVAYGDRNTRYTSFAGMLLSEAIDPTLPMDAPDPHGLIPNPLNCPDLRESA